jgi:biopolymer transport protein TolR
MGMSVGGGGEDIKSEPNVVPMIDIMLVLLIIFMIVTPIISAGFQAEMPEAANIEKAEEEEGDVVLGIDEDGRYYLDPATGEIGPVAGAEWLTTQKDILATILTNVYQNRVNKIIFFRADRELPYEHVEDAMDIARKAGVRVLAAVIEEALQTGGGN